MGPSPLRVRLLCDRMHSGCNGCCSKEATAVKERREPTINKSPRTRLHSEAKLSRGRATKSKLEKTGDLSLCTARHSGRVRRLLFFLLQMVLNTMIHPRNQMARELFSNEERNKDKKIFVVFPEIFHNLHI